MLVTTESTILFISSTLLVTPSPTAALCFCCCFAMRSSRQSQRWSRVDTEVRVPLDELKSQTAQCCGCRSGRRGPTAVRLLNECLFDR